MTGRHFVPAALRTLAATPSGQCAGETAMGGSYGGASRRGFQKQQYARRCEHLAVTSANEIASGESPAGGRKRAHQQENRHDVQVRNCASHRHRHRYAGGVADAAGCSIRTSGRQCAGHGMQRSFERSPGREAVARRRARIARSGIANVGSQAVTASSGCVQGSATPVAAHSRGTVAFRRDIVRNVHGQ
jgi:hypothetical protein